MLGYVRLVVDEKGRQIWYDRDSLYHPKMETLDCLQDYFNEGMDLKFDTEEARDAELLISFAPRSYESNNYLDPVEYDFDLHIHNVIILRAGYKNSRWLEIKELMDRYSSCSEPLADSEKWIGDWEEIYDEAFYDFEPVLPQRDYSFGVFNQNEYGHLFNGTYSYKSIGVIDSEA